MFANPAALIRPVLKIVYEIATEWLGPTYANDPTAVALRRAICSGHAEDIDAEIGYFPPSSAFAAWAVPSVSHAVSMWAECGYGYVATRIFNVIEAKVRITDTLADYGIQPRRWIVLDPIRATVETGLEHPLQRRNQQRQSHGLKSTQASSTSGQSTKVWRRPRRPGDQLRR